MSDEARSLIKQAVKIYLEKDGATRFGSYRDVITDLLHLAHDDTSLRKDNYFRNYKVDDFALKELLEEGLDAFQEELANEEKNSLKSDSGETE